MEVPDLNSCLPISIPSTVLGKVLINLTTRTASSLVLPSNSVFIFWFPLSRFPAFRFSGPLLVNPLVLPQPFHGSQNSLLDGQPGFPSGRTDFFRVEKNERIVANPAL